MVVERVAEEMEKRKDEIEAEVLRRVEEAKSLMEQQVKPLNSCFAVETAKLMSRADWGGSGFGVSKGYLFQLAETRA